MSEREFTCCGYPCVIVRVYLGHLCGYVGLPEGHPYYGMKYGQIGAQEGDPRVHGGVTYTEWINPSTGDEDGFWWVGFDCAHAGDYSPGWITSDDEFLTAHEWTVNDVEEEIRSFAKQLKEVAL